MDYFKSVDKSDKDAVKKLYKQLVKKYHPDNGGEHVAFVALQEQYEFIISDKKTNVVTQYADDDIVFGDEACKQPKRAIVPNHVNVKFKMSIQELFKGLKEVIVYKRNVYRPNSNTPVKETITIELLVVSWALNKRQQRVFHGFGDQGLFDDKGDLILNIEISDPNTIINFDTKIPRLETTLLVPSHQDEVEIDLPNGATRTIPIKHNTKSFTLRSQGLRFLHASRTKLLQGDYKITLMRY